MQATPSMIDSNFVILKCARHARNFVATLLLCIATAACIPVAANFYKPSSSENGEITNYACDGAGGAPNSLSIRRDNVRLVIGVLMPPPPEGILRLFIPRGTTVQIETEKVQVVDSAGSVIGRYGGATVFDWKKSGARAVKKLAPSVNLLTGNQYTSDKYPSALYHVWLELKAPVPNTFYIKVPKMEINGTEYPAFSVRFQRIHETYFQPFNGC